MSSFRRALVEDCESSESEPDGRPISRLPSPYVPAQDLPALPDPLIPQLELSGLASESSQPPLQWPLPDYAPETLGSPSLPSSSSQQKKPLILTKDEDYFIESSFIVFQVENCLFRVPSHLLSKESHIFGGMFRLPHNGDAEGASEDNPIILPDEYTKKDFKNLLKALYPQTFTLRLSLTQEEWLSVLKLSTKWYFLNLRETAISELESPYGPDQLKLSSLEKIYYGRKYQVSFWLFSGLVDLVMRDLSINDDEALDIDSAYPTTAYKLFRARELRFRGFLNSRAAAEKEVESLFVEELSLVRADEKAYEAPEVEIELGQPEPVSVFMTFPARTVEEEGEMELQRSEAEAKEEQRRKAEEEAYQVMLHEQIRREERSVGKKKKPKR